MKKLAITDDCETVTIKLDRLRHPIAFRRATLSLMDSGLTEKEAELFEKIKAKYDEQVSPYYAASRLWTDAIIDPLDTRTWISMGIEAANHSPIEKKFNLGVIQT